MTRLTQPALIALTALALGWGAPALPSTPNSNLIQAAGEGRADEVARLLANGANPDSAVEGDGSALIAAARAGHIGIVRALVARGADVNLAVPGDGSPLIAAAAEGHEAIVRLLLARGAAVDRIAVEDESALMQASLNGREAIVGLLLASGADPNLRDAHTGRTALSEARRGGHSRVELMLRAAGAKS
jgi:ankyrin repeat protein